MSEKYQKSILIEKITRKNEENTKNKTNTNFPSHAKSRQNSLKFFHEIEIPEYFSNFFFIMASQMWCLIYWTIDDRKVFKFISPREIFEVLLRKNRRDEKVIIFTEN